MQYVVRSVKNEPERIWSSIELHELYHKKGGCELNRSRFINDVIEQSGNKMYRFNSPGMAVILMHKQKASTLFKLVSVEDEDDDSQVKKVADKIALEAKKLSNDKSKYNPDYT